MSYRALQIITLIITLAFCPGGRYKRIGQEHDNLIN
jgi:hypothetical protein